MFLEAQVEHLHSRMGSVGEVALEGPGSHSALAAELRAGEAVSPEYHSRGSPEWKSEAPHRLEEVSNSRSDPGLEALGILPSDDSDTERVHLVDVDQVQPRLVEEGCQRDSRSEVVEEVDFEPQQADEGASVKAGGDGSGAV